MDRTLFRVRQQIMGPIGYANPTQPWEKAPRRLVCLPIFSATCNGSRPDASAI